MLSSKDNDYILVVEDDQLMAQGIADILSLEGYHVEIAPNGRAAFMKMKVRTPNLVLSDIMMPEMNGHEFCALVRADPAWRTLPFIFLTALGQNIDHRKGLELGADDYLVKPFEPDDLLVAVRARMKRAADHQAVVDEVLSDLRASILTTLNHEFRTPLTYITGYTRMLAEDGRSMPEENFQSCLRALLHGSERLKRLVENVLLVSQIESGELEKTVQLFPRQTPDLNAVVKAAMEKRRSQAAESNVVLKAEVPENLPPLAIGEEYVAQVIDHLLENSIKFAQKDGGQITLTAGLCEGQIEIQVTDDGIGVRPDALRWVFDSFRQVDRQQREQQGAGLGLAIVRGLIQAHSGQVSLESQVGVGTTVTIQLPVATD